MIKSIQYVYDLNALKRMEGVGELKMNDIARVDVQLSSPIFVDSFRKNKATGSFIVMDEQSNETVAAGMIF